MTLGTKKMEYKGKQWHESCFSCFKCQVPIGNKPFVPRENDIICTDCFEVKYATRCVKCSEVCPLTIGPLETVNNNKSRL